MISARTAFTLYGLLIIVAALTLRGTALWLALAIVLGLAVKTLVDLLKRKIDN